MMASDRPLSKDLRPGTRLVWLDSSIVTLDRRKTPDEENRWNIPFRDGWWLKDNRGGLSDCVIDAAHSGWRILDEPGASAMSTPDTAGPIRTFAQQHGSETPDLTEWFKTLAKTVALDFDGVLHPYTDGWCGSVPADEPPTEGALEFVTTMHARGYRLVVFSTRCDHMEGLEGTKAWLDRWGFGPCIDLVTHEKPAAVAYVDDRAVPFVGTWAGIREAVELLAAGRAHGAASPGGRRTDVSEQTSVPDADVCSATNPDDGERCVRTVPHTVGDTAVATEHRSASSYSDLGYGYWHDGWARSRYGRANRVEHWRDR